MSWLRLLEWLLLPPAGPMLVILLGLVLWRRRIGLTLAALGVAALYAASVPFVVYPLRGYLQYDDALTEAEVQQAPAQAIVVLGAGRRMTAPEYGGKTVNLANLERLRYAAHLQRRTGLPIIPAGGRAPYDLEPGAVLMRRVLRDDFGAAVPWVEDRSTNTMENARFLSEALRERGMERVFVVTGALHMRRALWAFRQTDIQAIPAPTGLSPSQPGAFSWFPTAGTLAAGKSALHEALGLLWYRLRYG